MRIACLQFAPQVGDVDNNLNRADAVLSRANPQGLDLLVLPELAFSGYNFKSLHDIDRHLEHTASGITSLWARTIALKYECVVTVGYPEKVDVSHKWPASPEYYNSAITVNADGETVANYRKSFLYYRDETWALEGPDGFYDGEISGLGKVAMGICMDLNPYKFEAPWTAWEFAYHILHKQANLAILSMAWITQQDLGLYSRRSREPDVDVLSYWVSRLEPVIRAEDVGEIIVVIANRCGSEEEAIYAGTSCVIGIDEGEVKVYGILGRGEKELLVVDTADPPQFKLVAEPNAVIQEDTMQSRRAPSVLDPSLLEPSAQPPPVSRERDTRTDTPYPTGNRNQGRDALVASIDAILSEVPEVSPIATTSSHAFFGGESLQARERLENVKSSIPSSEDASPSTSISSSVQVLVPGLKDPTPPRSERSTGDKAAERRAERRAERSAAGPSNQPLERPLSAGRILGVLQIPPPVEWDNDDPDKPLDSASSMKVNTPWESSPALFRAEDILKTMKVPASNALVQQAISSTSSTVLPKPSSGSSSSSSKASIPVIPIASNIRQVSASSVPIVRSSTPTAAMSSSSKHSSPPAAPAFIPPTERPTSPKSRNTSRSRTPQREPTLATPDVVGEPAVMSIRTRTDDTDASQPRQPTEDNTRKSSSKDTPAPRKE